MSQSILVLGGGGMLGHKMFQVLGETFPNVNCTVRARAADSMPEWLTVPNQGRVIEGIDVTKLERLDEFLASARPDVIVNCVGTIKQREGAKDSLQSVTINSLLPHRLAAAAKNWGGRVIHFSTDCVFSGARGNYSEEDQSDAQDLYGRTKALGEVATENALTIRTSIIGRELSQHTSLLDWFLAQRGRTIRGFTRAWWSGVTTLHLSRLVARLLRDNPNLTGLFNLSSGRISKYDLLHMLRDAYGLSVQIEPDESFFCDRSLRGDAFAALSGYVFPGWPELLRDLVNDPTPYPSVA